MKFRGKMSDIGYMREFTYLLATISKLAKTCTLRIAKDKMYFIMSEKGNMFSSPTMWCEIEPEHFFAEYNMEGLNQEHDEIYLGFKPESLVKVLNTLKSSQSTRSLKLKLTKKHSPCLTFEIDSASLAASGRLCVHDVPVSVISWKLWPEYKKPDIPTFDLSICMPELNTMRPVMDNMKMDNQYMIIKATEDGEFSIIFEEEELTVTAHFKNLKTFSVDAAAGHGSESVNGSPRKTAQAQIETKKFDQFFASEQMNPTKIVCNVLDKKLIHLVIIHETLSLQYFIPAVAS